MEQDIPLFSLALGYLLTSLCDVAVKLRAAIERLPTLTTDTGARVGVRHPILRWYVKDEMYRSTTVRRCGALLRCLARVEMFWWTVRQDG